MISYIVYAITSILIWNISVVIMDKIGVPFYTFNPSFIIIPCLIFIKFDNDFKNKIDKKKLTIVYWTNYFILLLNTYFVFYFLYEKGFIQIPVKYMCCILFYILFFVLQNIISLYITGLEKNLSLYPFIIMISSFLISVIITLIKFQIFYGTFNQVFIWCDYKELIKEGFFVGYFVVYQLTLCYHISQKLIKYNGYDIM